MTLNNLNSINLNLMLVLRALIQTQSVTQAADLLGRTPSTISASLVQLRDIFGDPLFIRGRGGFEPTPRALQLRGPVEAAIHQIGLVFEHSIFEPGSSQRGFAIAAPDTIVASLGPRISERLSEQGPEMTLRFRGLESDLIETMGTGMVDFAILPEAVLGNLSALPLAYHPVGVVELDSILMRKGHELEQHSSLSIDRLREFPHVIYRPDDPFSRNIQSHLGLDFVARVTVSHFLAVPSFIEDTDLIALAAARHYENFINHQKFTLVRLREAIPIPFGLVWSSVFENDDAHHWFKDFLLKNLTLPE